MRFHSFAIRLLPVALASALCPWAARAADGVIEINQAKIITGAGFPFQISQSGSYRLTSNLTISDSALVNRDAIVITAGDVNLDLNGFEITGPVTCSGLTGSALTCGPSGSGIGINSTSLGFVSVRHGTVSGFGGDGVRLSGPAWIDALQVRSNGGDGIFDQASTAPALVENSNVIQNGGVGIHVGISGSGAVIQGCIASGNHSGGISTREAVVIGNSVSNNGTFGINATIGSVIRDNEASGNQGAGIASTSANLINQNSAYSNQFDGIDAGTAALVSDNSANSNQGAGINADSGSSVQRNTTTGNSVDGLYLVPTTTGAPSAAYRANVMSANKMLPVAVGTVSLNMGANECNGTQSCP